MLGAWLLVQLQRSATFSSAGGESKGDSQAYGALLVVKEALTIVLGCFLVEDLRLTWLSGRTETWAFSGVCGGFDVFGDASNKNVGGRGRGLVGVVGGAS